MKRINIIIVAIIFFAFACKQKENKCAKREDEIAVGSTVPAENTAPVTEGTVQAAISPVQIEEVKAAEKVLEKPELTPKDVLREMNKLAKDEGVAALKVGMCSADRVYMDSLMSTAARLEKALDMNMMGMIDGQMSQTRWDETKFSFGTEKITGNTATLDLIDKKSKKSQPINFIKENGAWKICENVKEKSKGQQDPIAMMNMFVKMVETATPEAKKKFKEMMLKNMESMKSIQNSKDTLANQ